MTTRLPEENESIWGLAAPAALWAGHFFLSYCTAAIWCAKLAGPDGASGLLRAVIGVYTLIALAAIAHGGWRGWTRYRLVSGRAPHDVALDSAEGRHRFLGLTTFLLSGMSGVAVVLTALAVALVGSCD